ncbi:MAG: hypothetical protein R3D71_04270 [Rickettsiales bacterium]
MTQNTLFSIDRAHLSKFPRNWLILGVIGVAIAGLFSLILVTARTPGFCGVPFFTKLFREALVVHVDLSVLSWFLAIACMFWSLSINHIYKNTILLSYIQKAAQICFALSVIFISLSPVSQQGEGVMSNYIPVITNYIFFLGLSFLLCGVVFAAISMFFSYNNQHSVFSPPINFAVLSSGIITLFSVAAFLWSFYLLPPEIDGQQFYEIGFWGGGHVLQFTHTQIMMVCWLWLAITLKPSLSVSSKLLYIIFSFGLIAAFITPIPYLLFDVTSMEYRDFFTDLMIFVGGIAPIIMLFIIFPVFFNIKKEDKKKNRAIYSSLIMSVILFVYGGVLGSLIHGQNIVIPAHYHGSIVGITLAFMGVSYLLLPYFGYRKVTEWKMTFWQPIIYGGGQLLHISGLAYSGGYGKLQRKTPCGALELTPDVKVAMGMMGGGGLLAIIGGLLFVIVIVRATRK